MNQHFNKVWYGVIFLHQGIYEGGVFRFTLFIPDNFDCPRVIFNPIVYHPLISTESGELDVKQYISNWKYYDFSL
jgi:ubiquitin-protein ligase